MQTQHQSTTQLIEATQSARNVTIAALLKRLEEAEETNSHLRKLLKEKKASSSSSGKKYFKFKVILYLSYDKFFKRIDCRIM